MGNADSVQPLPRLSGSLGMQKPLQLLQDTMRPESAEVEDDDDADVFVALTRTSLLSHVCNPRDVREWVAQPPPVYKNRLLQDVPTSSVTLRPCSVLLHIYDLMDELQAANGLLAFKMTGLSVGGAFHAGVEVFGNEWTYGTLGVCCEAPRTAEAHVYRCSIPLGETKLVEREVATVLHTMCRRWRGKDYEILDKNCCRFSAEFCDKLGVGPMPAFIDRFARLLGNGRAVGRGAMELGGKVRAMVLGAGKSVPQDQEYAPAVDSCLCLERQRRRIPKLVAEDSRSNRGPIKFPIGAVVEYHSNTNRIWIPAKVLRYDDKSGTYDLDCRAEARPQNIRWPQQPVPREVAGATQNLLNETVPQELPEFHCMAGGSASSQRSPPSSSEAGRTVARPQEGDVMLELSGGRANAHETCANAQSCCTARPRATSPEIVFEDSKRVILGISVDMSPKLSHRECYSDAPVRSASPGAFGLPVTDDEEQPKFVPGTIVEYESSLGWISAKVFHYYPSKGVYDLDCKGQVPPCKLRPKQGSSAASASDTSEPITVLPELDGAPIYPHL
mmetsp:Transcript_3681/g.9351  ORF Transcript_3681/g.9351 Transcript_3681/m.9351 type:complete len:558 (+) Transcript_3681:69-1742(+)